MKEFVDLVLKYSLQLTTWSTLTYCIIARRAAISMVKSKGFAVSWTAVTLSCFACGKPHDPNLPQTVCSDCGKPLRVEYDLGKAAEVLQSVGSSDIASMWRYAAALPPCEPVSLGEGHTPLVAAEALGIRGWIKDEAENPTRSFKDRGMSAAISMARQYGFRAVAAPSAGNAGASLAAYAQAAGMRAIVAMPKDTPSACIEEARKYGAEVILLDGLITDCGRAIAEIQKEQPDIFNLATLREPFRIEGKKTMAYELVEQLQEVPDVIVYPTGGGTGLIGMWKAFDEMEALGWIGKKRPRMVSVQASGCAPIVRAFEEGLEVGAEISNPHTKAAGLRVPRAIGDFLMLRVLRDSGGTAVAVEDDEMIACAREIEELTGVSACPEGGATLAAARKLTHDGWIQPDDTVVLFNTAAKEKYLEAFE